MGAGVTMAVTDLQTRECLWLSHADKPCELRLLADLTVLYNLHCEVIKAYKLYFHYEDKDFDACPQRLCAVHLVLLGEM